MNVNDVFQQSNNYTIDNPKYKKGSRKERMGDPRL